MIEKFKILSRTKELPLPVFSDQEYSEEIRLKYRFLDLRRNKIHNNIMSKFYSKSQKTMPSIRIRRAKPESPECLGPKITKKNTHTQNNNNIQNPNPFCPKCRQGMD